MKRSAGFDFLDRVQVPFFSSLSSLPSCRMSCSKCLSAKNHWALWYLHYGTTHQKSNSCNAQFTRHMNSHAKKLYLSFIYNLLLLQSPLQTLPCFPVTVQRTQCSNSQEFFAMDLVCHWKKSKSNQRKGFCRSISSSESNLNNKRSFRSFWCNNRNVFIHPIVP